MGASVEPPDGALAVERQGGVAEAMHGSAAVAAEAQARVPDSGLSSGDPEVRAGDAKRARVPSLDIAPGQRDVQPRHLREQPALALGELSAARRVTSHPGGPGDTGLPGR